MMKIMQSVCVLATTALLASCASIKSIESPASGTADGLTYFLPSKDIAITVTVDASSNISGVSISTTASYPDISTRYVLQHGGNAFGKNTLDVGVTQSGLLTSTKSTTVSSVNEAFKSLATSIGTLGTLDFDHEGIPVVPACAKAGPHTFIFKVDAGGGTACGLHVTITKLGPRGGSAEHTKEQKRSVAGIYYRQNEPYEVTVIGAGIISSSIVFSPSDSNTYFLPASRTFFANNEADFALADGVPTRYKQETASEVLSLLKLPSDVIGAYFAAVGKVFESFKSNDSKEAAALSEAIKLELMKRKYEACLEAIGAGDDGIIKTLGC